MRDRICSTEQGLSRHAGGMQPRSAPLSSWRTALPRLSRAARLLAPALMLFSCGTAMADDAAARGAAVVDQWCRLCHQRVTDAPDPDLAPPFETIVARDGRDAAFFTRFLREDHFPMTTFRLFDDEKADVVAYLLALRQGRASRP